MCVHESNLWIFMLDKASGTLASEYYPFY